MPTLHLDRICGIIHEVVVAGLQLAALALFGWMIFVVGLVIMFPDNVRF